MVYIGARDLTQQHQEKAIELLRRGYTPQEAHRKYPQSNLQQLERHPAYTGDWNLTAKGRKAPVGEVSIQQQNEAKYKQYQKEATTKGYGGNVQAYTEAHNLKLRTQARTAGYGSNVQAYVKAENKKALMQQQSTRQELTSGQIPVSEAFYAKYQQQAPEIERIREQEAVSGRGGKYTGNEYIEQRYFPYGSSTKRLREGGKFEQKVQEPYGEKGSRYYVPYGSRSDSRQKALDTAFRIKQSKAGFWKGAYMEQKRSITENPSKLLKEVGIGVLGGAVIVGAGIPTGGVGSGLLMGAWLGEKEYRLLDANRKGQLTAGKAGAIVSEIPREAITYGVGGYIGGKAIGGVKSGVKLVGGKVKQVPTIAKSKILQYRVNRAMKPTKVVRFEVKPKRLSISVVKKPPKITKVKDIVPFVKQESKALQLSSRAVSTKLRVDKLIGGKAVSTTRIKGGRLKQVIKYKPIYDKPSYQDPRNLDKINAYLVKGRLQQTGLQEVPSGKPTTLPSTRQAPRYDITVTGKYKTPIKSVKEWGGFGKRVDTIRLTGLDPNIRANERGVLNLRYYGFKTKAPPKLIGTDYTGEAGRTWAGTSITGTSTPKQVGYQYKVGTDITPKKYVANIFKGFFMITQKGKPTKFVNILGKPDKVAGGSTIATTPNKGGNLILLQKGLPKVTGTQITINQPTRQEAVTTLQRAYGDTKVGVISRTFTRSGQPEQGYQLGTLPKSSAMTNLFSSSKSKLSQGLFIMPTQRQAQTPASVQGLLSAQLSKQGLRTAQGQSVGIGQMQSISELRLPAQRVTPKLTPKIITTPVYVPPYRPPKREPPPRPPPPTTRIPYFPRLETYKTRRYKTRTFKQKKGYVPTLWQVPKTPTVNPKFISSYVSSGTELRPFLKVKTKKTKKKKVR